MAVNAEGAAGNAAGQRAPQAAWLVLGLLTATPVAPVHAVDLSWQPQLRVGTRSTDNLRSTVDDQEAVWGFDTGGGLALKAATDTWQTNINPGFNVRRFVIGENADAEEYNVRSQSQWAVNERAALSLVADYARDSTLTTDQTDAGVETDIINRDTVTLQPAVNYALTDLTSVNASFLYSDVTFKTPPGGNFVNYDYKQVNVGATRYLNDTLTLFGRGFVSEFRTPSRDSSTLTYGSMGGVNYRHSETLDGDFSVGYSMSDIDFVSQTQTGVVFAGFNPLTGQPIFQPVFTATPDSTSSGGPIASATIRKNFENLKTSLVYNRAVSPSTRGTQTIADDIVVILEQRLSSRLTLGLRGGYNMQSAEADEVGAVNQLNLDRDQVLVMPSVRYRFTEEFSISAVYRFVWSHQAEPVRNTYNNSLFVTLSYVGVPNTFDGL